VLEDKIIQSFFFSKLLLSIHRTLAAEKKKKRKSVEDNFTSSKNSDVFYFAILQNTNPNKPKCKCSASCLLECFKMSDDTIDLNAGLLFLKQKYEEVRTRSSNDLADYYKELVRSCLSQNGESILFKIKEKEVCREAFAAAHNISKNKLQKIRKALQSNNNRRKNSSSSVVKTSSGVLWKDEHVHNYDYEKTSDIFNRNVENFGK
jgi:hypothetical protein